MSEAIKKKVPEVQFVNAIYNLVKFFGWEPFKLEKSVLQRKAIKQAGGLTDFGDPRYEEGLDSQVLIWH
jgi:hypothetical protein